jgi:hypothetical protein
MSVCPVSSKRGSLSLAGLLCLAAGVLPSTAHAQFITNSPDPFQGSLITLEAPSPQPFPPLGFAQIYTINNISETNNMVMGGNDVIDYNALLDVNFYTTPALTSLATKVSLPGTFEVTLMNRTNPFETGTFDYQIDAADFSGNILGHTLTVSLNPANTSGGMTTITPGPGVGQFTITAPAVLYGEHSVDGGPPVTGPPLTVTVGPPSSSAVPEPGLYQMTVLMGLGGLLTWRRTKRRN